MSPQQSPYVLYSDGEGNVYEDTSLYALGRSGWHAYQVPAEDWIELPAGGSLYELPGRAGLGGPCPGLSPAPRAPAPATDLSGRRHALPDDGGSGIPRASHNR